MQTYFVLVAIFLVVFILLWVKPVRTQVLSRPLLMILRKLGLVPPISETEKMAIEAGQVGLEKQFYEGRLKFKDFKDLKTPKLSDEEQKFLDGPVAEVCELITDWEIWENQDLTEECWEFLKKNKFFGMIIPKEYDGLEFSRLAHSEVIGKLSSHSIALAITTMVPNSLGPAELLMEYGTDKQKDYYLPRLARGEEIPCFGLTEPEAGSDASSISSYGKIFKDDEGKLKISLNWEKRWITLGNVATLIGIAFRLYDPDKLLGDETNLGITCALVPSDREGIDQSRRHDPLGVPFVNSPLFGKDVIIDFDDIIGGKEYIGKGWFMLTESLSAGRGISLPAQGTGAAKRASALITAHTNLRHQFGLPIGLFEGLQEPMARVYGLTYLMDATRKKAISLMEKDGILPVVSSMVKYYMTELERVMANDTMDIMGGKAITRGPKNVMAHNYIALPICITVEGANILTRTLMIFGQGVMRSHPYSYQFLASIQENDLDKFDKNFWGFNRHLVVNFFRTLRYEITRAVFHVVDATPKTKRYYQKLQWCSARFAFLTDLAMIFFGGGLKTKELVTGRFADVLSYQFMALACLRDFEEKGSPENERPQFEYAMNFCFHKTQEGFVALAQSLDFPIVGWFFKTVVAKWYSFNTVGGPLKDKTVTTLARHIFDSPENRDILTAGIFISKKESNPQRQQEEAYKNYRKNLDLYQKMKKATKKGDLKDMAPYEDKVQKAVEGGFLTEAEAKTYREVEEARLEAIRVDSFKA